MNKEVSDEGRRQNKHQYHLKKVKEFLRNELNDMSETSMIKETDFVESEDRTLYRLKVRKKSKVESVVNEFLQKGPKLLLIKRDIIPRKDLSIVSTWKCK